VIAQVINDLRMESPRRKYGRMMRGSKDSNFPTERALKRNLENRGKVRTSEFIGSLCGESSVLKGLVTLYESKIKMERKTAAQEKRTETETFVELPVPSRDSNIDDDVFSDKSSADGSNYKEKDFAESANHQPEENLEQKQVLQKGKATFVNIFDDGR